MLTVALFPQRGLKFIENRHNPSLERYRRRKPRSQWQSRSAPPPASTPWRWKAKPLWSKSATAVTSATDGGCLLAAPAPALHPPLPPGRRGTGVRLLAGTVWKVLAAEGQTVAAGEVLLIPEAMKMGTEIRAAQAGTVRGIAVKAGDAVAVGEHPDDPGVRKGTEMESLNALIQGMGPMRLAPAAAIMLLVSLLLLGWRLRRSSSRYCCCRFGSAACSPISRRPGWRSPPCRACWLTTTRRSWR